MAVWEDGSLGLHALTLDPFELRRSMARLLDMHEKRVRVRAVRCGPLAGRLLPAALAAAYASLLAWRSGKAVRLLYEYRDLELWSSGSTEAVIKHETALTGEGS